MSFEPTTTIAGNWEIFQKTALGGDKLDAGTIDKLQSVFYAGSASLLATLEEISETARKSADPEKSAKEAMEGLRHEIQVFSIQYLLKKILKEYPAPDAQQEPTTTIH